MESITGLHGSARRRALCLGVSACMLLLAVGAGSAQELPTGVTVSSTAGVPGAEITTPIYLASAQGARPGAVTLSISYPSELLTFKKVDSDLMDAFGFTVGTTLKTKDDGKTSALELDFKSKGANGNVIPDGPIARVTFEISAKAQLSTDILLEANVVIMTADDPPTRLDPVKAYSGKIQITGEAVFACFFYMH